MEILAISGSIRTGSFNSALLDAMSILSPGNIKITLFDSIACTPIFNPEIDEDNLPEAVKSLISNIRKADAIIIASPEYAHGITGVLKNMLDWLVASDALVLKPIMVTLVSTSGLGGVRSYSALVQILTAMNSNVVIEGSLCIPFAAGKFDDTLRLTDEITKERIKVSLKALERIVNHNNV